MSMSDVAVMPTINKSMGMEDSPKQIKVKKQHNSLKLSDIIFIISPDNEIYDNNSYYIEYIDQNKVKIVNISSMKQYKLRVNKDGSIGDGTINEIIVVERDSRDGYARQNEIIPGKWINIYFDGDTPAVLTGEITNLENDMIEITSYPDNMVLYIDFAYKGIPENINIKLIELRNSPPASSRKDTDEDDEEISEEQEDINSEPQMNIEDNEPQQEGEEDEDDNEDEPFKFDSRPRPDKIIQNYLDKADERIVGPVLGSITMRKGRDTRSERFDIQTQTEDLLDELVIKNSVNGNTPESLNKIKREIERFIELRKAHSNMDQNGTIKGMKKNTAKWRPLAESLEVLDKEIKWLIPVVKNIQKLELSDLEIGDSVNNDVDISKEISNELNHAVDVYTRGGNGELIDHYKRFIDTISRTFQPAIEPSSEDADVLATVYATLDILSIVDNIGNFRSTKWKHGILGECRMYPYRSIEPASYLNQRDVNMEKIERTGRTKSHIKELMSVKSFISLPYSAVKFSSIDRPNTNIATKSAYGKLYSLYHKSITRRTKINRIVIDKFNMGSVYNSGTFNAFNNYTLSISSDKLQDKSPPEIYREYLNTIIPKTRNLIDTIATHTTSAVNLHDYVSHLEPYLIYLKDLTFTQTVTINGHISNNIEEYIRNYKNQLKDFSKLKTLTHTSYYNGDNIKRLVETKLQTDVFDKYNHQGHNYSNSEYLSNIIKVDGGRLFYDAITIKNLDNLIHENIHIIVQELQSQENASLEGKKESENKCQSIIMSKQYFKPEEIVADNEREIYFDKKYDTTQYSMLIKEKEAYANTIEKFANEHSRMSTEEFFDFIRKKVAPNLPNGDPDLDYVTENIIRGKKRVRDGDYAMYYDDSADENMYYQRINNVWKIDKTIDKNVTYVDPTTQCNLQPGCVAVSTNGDPKCEKIRDTKKDIRKDLLKQLVASFDEKYNLTKDQLAEYIKNKYAFDFNVIDKLKIKRVNELCKYDNEHFKMGLKAGSYDEVIRSPHLSKLDDILSQTDLSKKYNDLVYFTLNYTEEHTTQELDNSDPKAWRYCKTTKTNLVPMFLFSLATAWNNDGADYDKPTYRLTLDHLIKNVGRESDDGGFWVDKNSGRVICKKTDSNDEGYDELGRKNISHAVIEEGYESKYLNQTKKSDGMKKFYSSPETKIMFDVVTTLSSIMHINILDSFDFIISLASSTFRKPGMILSEADYKIRVNKAAQEGRKLPPYKYVYDHTILFLTLGAFLIGVQTTIPGVISKKTRPGCIKSFTGYPTDLSGDRTGLEYLVCVSHAAAAPIGVWKVLQRKKEDYIQKEIIKFVDAYYVNHIDVKQRIREKITYMLDNPSDAIPQEISINNWTTFLPPLIDINVKVENIKEEYRKLLISDIKSGSPKQWERLNVIHGKIVHFSLYVQQGIQEIIDKEHSRTKLAHSVIDGKVELYMEEDDNSLVTQFGLKDCEIKTAIDVVNILQKIDNDVYKLNKAGMLFCPVNTKNIYASLRNDFNEETIYRAFIDICKFNRNIEPDESYLPICGDKPDNINKNDTISEKIRKLQQQGKSYDANLFEKLLQKSGMKNRIGVNNSTNSETQVTRLMSMMEDIEEDSKFYELKQYLEIILDSFDIEKIGNDISEEVRALRNYLSKHNQEMTRDIISNFDTHLSLSPKETKRFKIFFKTITKWQYDENNDVSMYTSYYNCFEFIKKHIINILQIFPKMILNAANHQEVWTDETEYAKRLNLSMNATNSINDSNYERYKNIEGFYHSPIITKVLNSISNKCNTLMKFVEHTPYFSRVSTEKETITSVFDKDTCAMLFEYYLLTAFSEYIELSEQEDMLNTNNNENYGIEDLNRRTDLSIPEIDPSVIESDLTALKTEVCRMIFTFGEIMQKHRDDIDVTSMQLMDTNFRIRETEKQRITSRLEAMTDEDRELDTIMKINKMGIWNEGLQKSLKTHVKESYDEQREFREAMQEAENAIRKKYNNVTEDNVSQMLDEHLEQNDIDLREESEAYDLSGYYGEDGNSDPDGMEQDQYNTWEE